MAFAHNECLFFGSICCMLRTLRGILATAHLLYYPEREREREGRSGKERDRTVINTHMYIKYASTKVFIWLFFMVQVDPWLLGKSADLWLSPFFLLSNLCDHIYNCMLLHYFHFLLFSLKS